MNPWEHDHIFGQDEKKPGEGRTLIVVVLTAITMVLEILAGWAFGSMALLADGLHMASHATALAIAMVAYVYARCHAYDDRYAFGTGKVNSLAGYTGAVLLALFGLLMAWESLWRLIAPTPIAFDQALVVAVVGLVVNGLSVLILGAEGDHQHEGVEYADDHRHHGHEHHHDHNLRSAYFHVLADALTSVLAIVALLAGKYQGWIWLDPAMGIVGAILVARWSLGLLKITSRVLLDRRGPRQMIGEIRDSLQRDGDQVADLHLWPIAPGRYSLVVSVLSQQPKSPEHYRRMLPRDLPLAHVSVEVWPCDELPAPTTEPA